MQIEKKKKEEESIAFFYLQDDVIMQIYSLRKKDCIIWQLSNPS